MHPHHTTLHVSNGGEQQVTSAAGLPLFYMMHAAFLVEISLLIARISAEFFR